ncbi:MAG: hypothetical protein WC438_06095 [Candidatus Pacearchaeota archaeon]
MNEETKKIMREIIKDNEFAYQDMETFIDQHFIEKEELRKKIEERLNGKDIDDFSRYGLKETLDLLKNKKYMKKKDFKNIYIRAIDKEGNWGSFNFRELIDMGCQGQIVSWFLQRTIGLKEAEVITEKHILNIIKVLDDLYPYTTC